MKTKHIKIHIKMVLRKFIALPTCIRKDERSKTDDPCLHLKKGATEHKVNRRRKNENENKTVNRKATEKMNETWKETS
jgi:hypothetical protein